MNGLLFIRHAQTDLAGTFCGHSDPPLNAAGQQQVCDLIVQLPGESFNAIYSSDLRRAVDTAEPLAQTFAAPLTKKRGLREIHFGDWEGLTWAEIEQRHPSQARLWSETFPALPAPGGESFADFESRVMAELASLLSLSEHQRIAVVTHAGVMRTVLRSLYGCSEQEAWAKTNSYCCTFSWPIGLNKENA
jgi:alpha-ribazole phosphatase/probable phosphoglycerate mutase